MPHVFGLIKSSFYSFARGLLFGRNDQGKILIKVFARCLGMEPHLLYYLKLGY